MESVLGFPRMPGAVKHRDLLGLGLAINNTDERAPSRRSICTSRRRNIFNDERRRRDNFAADGIERPGTEMKHGDDPLLPQHGAP